MGLWTNLRDAAESAISTVTPFDIRSESARNKKGGTTGFLNNVREGEQDLFNKATGRISASDRRATNQMLTDQVNSYKEMTEISKKQIAEKKDEQSAEKRKINEKQIRSLRRNYRPQGIMNAGSNPNTIGGESDKLGG
jgi:hypothetical protein